MHVVCNSCYPRTKTVYIVGFPTEKNVGSCVFPFRFSKVGFHSCIFYSSPSFFVFVKIRKMFKGVSRGMDINNFSHLSSIYKY